MDEGKPHAGSRPPVRTSGTPLTRDGRAAPGWVGVALLVPGAGTSVVAFRADRIERLMADVERSLRMTPQARDNPGTHAALWRAVLDLARIVSRQGDLGARERLGRHALWLALNAPGGEVRRRFDALLRDGLPPHVTLSAQPPGLWHCAIGTRFDGAAEVAARSFVALDAAPVGPLPN